MIHLDTSTRSLMIALSANVSTTQLDVVSSFYDVPARTKDDNSDYLGAAAVTTTNNSTHITAVAAPNGNVTRNLRYLSIFNADITSAAISVKIDDNGTKKTLVKQTVTTGQTLAYEDQFGWYIK